MKKNQLGKPWGELRDELYAENPGMEQDVAVLVEELRIQAQLFISPAPNPLNLRNRA